MTQNASDGIRVELRGRHFSLSNVARLKESGILFVTERGWSLTSREPLKLTPESPTVDVSALSESGTYSILKMRYARKHLTYDYNSIPLDNLIRSYTHSDLDSFCLELYQVIEYSGTMRLTKRKANEDLPRR